MRLTPPPVSADWNARENARRLARARRLAHLVHWELHLEGGSLRWSDDAGAVLGVRDAADVATVDALLDLVHPEDRARLALVMSQPWPHTIEYRVVDADGTERVVHQSADIERDEFGRACLAGATQDVTALRQAERNAEKLAFFDELTGLPNRLSFQRHLARIRHEAMSAGETVAVLCIGLDGFKRVNDTLGYPAGDAVLREFTERLTSCARFPLGRADDGVVPDSGEVTAASSFACRLGGDEFAVVLRRLGDPSEAIAFARRIADRLAAGFSVAGTDIFISSSTGIAVFPDEDASTDGLFGRAEAAMHHAKKQAGSTVHLFEPSVHDEARQRLGLENTFRSAVARLTQVKTAEPIAAPEFYLVYQPKVEMPHGGVVGVEALLRWRSVERGVVSPAEFIPLAEETGLIGPLGEWVLRQACEQAKRWADVEGEALRVAVNVSAKQFADPDFPTVVATVLCEVGVDPSLLELEITESVLMQDTIAGCQVLLELKELGIRIALDDFGTGQSSLSYLARLPVDSLKIDRSFIGSIGNGGRAETITAAIIALARSLSLDVVAEGVETLEQLDFVAKYGEVEIQGYYFAKPMEVAALRVWREERAAHLAPSTVRLVAANAA